MVSKVKIIKDSNMIENNDVNYLKLDSKLQFNLISKLKELVSNNEIIKNEIDQKEINDLILDLSNLSTTKDDLRGKSNENHGLFFRELKIPNLEKFVANMDVILTKLKPYDPKTCNLTSWFLNYDIYCDIYNWSDSERLLGLTYFFDSGLNKLIFLQKEFKYLEVKQNLVNFVDAITNLNGLPFIRHEHIQLKMEQFNEYGFTTYERIYWFNCYFPIAKIKDFYNSSNAYDQTWEKQFFNQII